MTKSMTQKTKLKIATVNSNVFKKKSIFEFVRPYNTSTVAVINLFFRDTATVTGTAYSFFSSATVEQVINDFGDSSRGTLI